MRHTSRFIILIALVCGCEDAPEEGTGEGTDNSATIDTSAVVESVSPPAQHEPQTQVMLRPVTDPANATITGIYDDPIMLSNGLFEGAPFQPDSPVRPRVVMAPELTIEGDLDGDAQLETVIFLEENSGGTGHFLYFAVLDKASGAYVNVATQRIGDRVDVRDARIEDGKILVALVQGGPDDAACCATQLATRTWTLENATLQEQAMKIEGTLSLETLRGTTWRLVKFGLDGEPIEGVDATLSFTEEGVAGSAGCNRYSGQAESGEHPGKVRIGPLVSTKMLCADAIMGVETRYLPKLEAVTHFEFFNRYLLLHSEGTEPAPMVFERVAESATD